MIGFIYRCRRSRLREGQLVELCQLGRLQLKSGTTLVVTAIAIVIGAARAAFVDHGAVAIAGVHRAGIRLGLGLHN